MSHLLIVKRLELYMDLALYKINILLLLLLFLIYVNDIANRLTHSKLIYFADDTTVFLSSKCINDLYKNMNSDLDDLTNNYWFKANRLALNVNKSNCMLFQPNGNQNTLGNTLTASIQ